MQIDGNWKLCQVLKSVSPMISLKIEGQFRFKYQFYSASARHSQVRERFFRGSHTPEIAFYLI